MKYIGFKNFRKFEVFPNIELAPITMLVGGNNAGKSTVVKGILALSDFFSTRNEIIDDYADSSKYATVKCKSCGKLYKVNRNPGYRTSFFKWSLI